MSLLKNIFVLALFVLEAALHADEAVSCQDYSGQWKALKCTEKRNGEKEANLDADQMRTHDLDMRKIQVDQDCLAVVIESASLKDLKDNEQKVNEAVSYANSFAGNGKNIVDRQTSTSHFVDGAFVFLFVQIHETLSDPLGAQAYIHTTSTRWLYKVLPSDKTKMNYSVVKYTLSGSEHPAAHTIQCSYERDGEPAVQNLPGQSLGGQGGRKEVPFNP